LSSVGFSELFLLFIIGLLILGPERLPRVASQIGRWVGRARRTANQLRYQLEREIAQAEVEQPKTKPVRRDNPAAGKITGEESIANKAGGGSEPVVAPATSTAVASGTEPAVAARTEPASAETSAATDVDADPDPDPTKNKTPPG
jgi:sec-independent protein translocase protein TatB